MVENIIETFVPNYIEIYLSCSTIPGFKFDGYKIPVFHLLHIRSESTIEGMGSRIVNTIMKEKKDQWQRCISLLNKRRRKRNKVCYGGKFKKNKLSSSPTTTSNITPETTTKSTTSTRTSTKTSATCITVNDTIQPAR